MADAVEILGHIKLTPLDGRIVLYGIQQGIPQSSIFYAMHSGLEERYEFFKTKVEKYSKEPKMGSEEFKETMCSIGVVVNELLKGLKLDDSREKFTEVTRKAFKVAWDRNKKFYASEAERYKDKIDELKSPEEVLKVVEIF